MEKKTVTTVAIILLLSMLVCSTMFNISDEEVIDNIYNQHRNVTALNQTTKMDTVISKVETIDKSDAINYMNYLLIQEDGIDQANQLFYNEDGNIRKEIL